MDRISRVKYQSSLNALITTQKLLKNLQCIAVRNLNLPECHGKFLHFSLGLPLSDCDLYVSEKIRTSKNPTWQSFHLSTILKVGSCNQVASNFVVVRVFCDETVLFSWLVHLSALMPVAAVGQPLPQDCLLFGLFENWFCTSELKPRSISEAAAVCLKSSYSARLLTRMQKVMRANLQTQSVQESSREKIRDRLKEKQEMKLLQGQREERVQRMLMLRRELQKGSARLEREKEKLEALQMLSHQKVISLENQLDRLHKDQRRLEERKKCFYNNREELLKISENLSRRTSQLLSELASIYPIEEVPVLNQVEPIYRICGVHLPHSDKFRHYDDTEVSVALGFASHLVMMQSRILNIPLRYPICFFGSRTTVKDLLMPNQQLINTQEFPLHTGQERYLFEYGVFLLNKNIAQLRAACSQSTKNLWRTLPNLNLLFTLRPVLLYSVISPNLRGFQTLPSRSSCVTTVASHSNISSSSSSSQSSHSSLPAGAVVVTVDEEAQDVASLMEKANVGNDHWHSSVASVL